MRRTLLLLLCLLAGWPALLAAQTIAPEATHISYDRNRDFGVWRAGQDRCNTRCQVLERDSSIPTVTINGKVTVGWWHDPYTGESHRDAAEIDIDHLVPLKEAHVSGAWRWTREQRRDYANDLSDPHHLKAVSRTANRSKGSRDPASWLPPDKDYHCDYVQHWVGVKRRWKLSMDPLEAERIIEVLISCLQPPE